MKKFIRNTALLAGATIAGLYAVNTYIEDSATKNHILATRGGHFFHWKYGEIFYTKEGSGNPVLLVHNLTPDSSGYEWVKVKHQLSKEHTVYTIDLLGCGRSDKPALTYTNFLYVQLLQDFIKKAIGKKTDLVISGKSSSFAIMADLMNPEFIGKLILINPSSLEENCQLAKKNNPVSKVMMQLPVLGTYVYNVIMRRNYIKGQCANDYCSKKYYVTPDMIDAYYESAHLSKSHGKFLYASIISRFTNVDIRKALQKIEAPVYIIESANHAEDLDVISEYKELKEDVSGLIVRNTECMPQIEAPRKTCDYINKFLSL